MLYMKHTGQAHIPGGVLASAGGEDERSDGSDCAVAGSGAEEEAVEAVEAVVLLCELKCKKGAVVPCLRLGGLSA